MRKALDRDIDQRYQSAAEFAVDLREWLRAHATSASSQNVLESLVDLEAPTHAPQPMTEAPRATVASPELADATVDLGTGRRHPGPPRPGAQSPTHASQRTVLDDAAGATVGPGATRVVPPPIARRGRRVERRNPLPWIALAAVATAVVAGIGYMAWRSQQAPDTPPVTQAAATPAPPPTTVATPTPPPVTVAPQPTFAPPKGQAAASVRAATAAFNQGQYDRAATSARKALGQDPSNTTAQDVLDKAENGQKAAARIRAGDAALARGDFAAAEAEVASARALAPWDRSVAALATRIDQAKLEARQAQETQARQAQVARVNELLNQGVNALSAKNYDAAIDAYDQALRLDPGNQAAMSGKGNAVTAKNVSEAAASGGVGAGAARGFVAAGSVAKGSDLRGGQRALPASRRPPG